MKSHFQSLFICLILLTGSHFSNAQSFDEKTKLINFGAKFWSGFTPIFVNAEFAVSSNVGIGAQVWYASEGNTIVSGEYITPGVFVNYHFPLTESKFDPYVGAGFNYWIISITSKQYGVNSSDH